MGPRKNTSGDLWTCADRDVCNGAFIGDQYVYVGSDQFPYVVGCWGPGPKPEYEPGCTKNGCGGQASDVNVANVEQNNDNSNIAGNVANNGAASDVGAMELGLAGFVICAGALTLL